MIDYAEKRDFLRMPIDCEMSFAAAGSDKKYPGSVINLSTRGILFTSGEKFDQGTELDITLTPSNSTTPPMVASVVVSRVSSSETLFEIACEFEAL